MGATVVGLAVSVQTGAPAGIPTPLSVTTCGLPTASLVTVRELSVETADVGLKVTFSVQLDCTCLIPLQLWVTAYTLLPLTMLVMVRSEPPVFFKLIVFAALVVPTAWLAKFSAVGLSETAGPTTPVPLRLTPSGLLAALLVMNTLPVRAPAVVGTKVTLIVQLALAAKVAAQVVVLAKSPLTVMLAMFSVAPPELVSVTLLAVLVLPIVCEPKDSDVTLSETTGLVTLNDC